MSLVIGDIPVPLKTDAEGVVWVGHTRVSLDTVVSAFTEGATAAEIVARYPSLLLADVYLVIGYYLHQQPAVEAYLAQRRQTAPEIRPQTGDRRRVINQGEIYWVPLEESNGLELGYTHPHVVIQDNIFNRSRINTLVVCALTSNLKRAKEPGNVLLEVGEANLPKQSVVVVSQVSTVYKTQLGDYIGSLTEQRVKQILAGMQFLQLFTERG